MAARIHNQTSSLGFWLWKSTHDCVMTSLCRYICFCLFICFTCANFSSENPSLPTPHLQLSVCVSLPLLVYWEPFLCLAPSFFAFISELLSKVVGWPQSKGIWILTLILILTQLEPRGLEVMALRIKFVYQYILFSLQNFKKCLYMKKIPHKIYAKV